MDELGAVIGNRAGETMTGTTVITGPWVKIDRQMALSFQAKWTGTPNGSFGFDVSNDDNPNSLASLMGPTPLTLPAAFAGGNPVGAAGSFGFEFPAGYVPYRWIRYVYTNASSTGLLWVAICGKGASS